MKEYIIAINGVLGNGQEHVGYFVGEGEGTIGIPNAAFSGNSFHVSRVEMSPLVFSEKRSEARVMCGKNMTSWLNRIINQLPYAELRVKEVRIIEVIP